MVLNVKTISNRLQEIFIFISFSLTDIYKILKSNHMLIEASADSKLDIAASTTGK